MASGVSSTSMRSGIFVARTIVRFVPEDTGTGPMLVVAVTAFVVAMLVTEATEFVAPGGFGTGGNQMPTSHCQRKSAAKHAARRMFVFRSMKSFATQSPRESACVGALLCGRTFGTGSQPHGPQG